MSRRRAFTLMEMMIVLAIIALVFAVSFKGMRAMQEQQALQEPFEKLRSLAKTAWQRSLTEQRAWQIRFAAGRFVLEPAQAVNKDDRAMFADSDRKNGRGSGLDVVKVDPDIMMEVRRWGQPHWFRLEKDVTAVWVFEQSGLCEPLSVRFSNERGTVGAQFDPLTASVKDEITDRL